MTPLTRRRSLMAVATAALLVAGIGVSAAPAQAASGSTSFYFASKLYADDQSAANAVRGSGASIVLGSSWKARYNGKETKPKFVVQRYTGKKWKTIKGVKTGFSSGRGAIAKLPAHVVPADKASQVVKYRFTSIAKGAIRNTSHSRTFKIKYENQAYYTGLAAVVYADMKPYCPTAAVRVDAKVGALGAVGLFQVTKSISVDPVLGTYVPDAILGVALHECAHQKQYYNYGGTYQGRQKAEKAAAAIYVNDIDVTAPPSPTYGNIFEGGIEGGFDSYEHGADCASHALNPAGYLGYGGYCNPNELAEGVRLMAGFPY